MMAKHKLRMRIEGHLDLREGVRTGEDAMEWGAVKRRRIGGEGAGPS